MWKNSFYKDRPERLVALLKVKFLEKLSHRYQELFDSWLNINENLT